MLITTSQPQSGSYVTFAFDKEALKLISKVALDPIYSVEANWKLVTLVFKQSNGNKKFTSAFRDFVNPKNSKLRSGMMSGDSMELQKIIISKTNRQHLVIYRNEISGAASFDFTLANSFAASSQFPQYINWDLKMANSVVLTEVDGGMSVTSEIPYKQGVCKSSSMALTGDFTIEYKVNGSNFEQTVFGVSSDLNLPTPSTHLQGCWGLLNWHAGHFDWTNALDNIIEKNFLATAGVEYSIKFQRSGSSVTVTVNDVLFESFSYSGTMYPFARVMLPGQPIISAARIA